MPPANQSIKASERTSSTRPARSDGRLAEQRRRNPPEGHSFRLSERGGVAENGPKVICRAYCSRDRGSKITPSAASAAITTARTATGPAAVAEARNRGRYVQHMEKG